MESSHDSQEKRIFIERPFEEVEGGYNDGNGFYCTPDGSFWDENGVYFDRDGIDKHGGTYDEYCIYIPGPGWNEELGCYDDEVYAKEIDQSALNIIQQNIQEELEEGFNYYKRLYNDDDNFDPDDELINKDEDEIFYEYMKNHFNEPDNN